jgi:agmatinase
MNKNVHTFIGCGAEYKDAKIVLFGAPFDGTASYRPGTRFAMSAMRGESYGIETYSPYQETDLSETAVFDAGDLELCFGNTPRVLSDVERFAEQILTDGKIPFLVGGEHLVTLGAVRALSKKYPDLVIAHFDAHCDLRNDYLGETLSHATVMRRCAEIVGGENIFQFGIRSGDREEFLYAKEHTNLCLFDFKDLPDALSRISGKPVYLTVDLDVLDPSVFPGTGTPEAGGVSFLALLDAVLKVFKCFVAGADLCELSPPLDLSGASTALACKLLREMLLALSK